MQNVKGLKLLLIFMFIVIAGCNNNSKTALPSATEDNLSNMVELTIEFDSQKYNIGDPVPITVSLRNSGKENILVNGRMAVNFSFSPDKSREIVFEIQSPSGRNLDPSKYITIRSPKDSDFVVLEAGAEVGRDIDLSAIYNFAVSGEYSIRAIYENTVDPSDGRMAWKGQVVSNQATFTLDQ